MQGQAVRSRVGDVFAAVSKMPPDMAALFEALFMRGKSEPEVRADLQLSEAEFSARRAAMLRSLKAAAG